MALCGGCSPSGSAVFSGLSHAQVTAEVLGAADVQAMGEPGWARHTGTYVGCMFTDYGAPASALAAALNHGLSLPRSCFTRRTDTMGERHRAMPRCRRTAA